MTSSNGNNSSDRLDRIERLLESVTQKTDSNARTIQGILEQRATDRLEHEERMDRLEDLVTRLTRIEEAQNRMLVGVDENQPTILRKLTTIENKVDRLIERNQ